MKMNWYFTQSHFPIFTCKLRYLTNGVVSIVSSCGTWATANMHGTKKRWISMSCIIAIDVLFWSCNFQCLSNEVFFFFWCKRNKWGFHSLSKWKFSISLVFKKAKNAFTLNLIVENFIVEYASINLMVMLT